MENTDPSRNNTVTNVTDNGKTVALLSYLTLIGWIVAFVMNSNQKTPLGSYHLRQTIMLFITGICLYIVQFVLLFVPYIGWLISLLMIFLYIGLVVLWLIGLIAAINGEMKPMPLIGKKAQEIFKGL